MSNGTWAAAGFNPRPPRGGRLAGAAGETSPPCSIRAPRAGGDLLGLYQSRDQAKFQSAPPARGATCPYCHTNPSEKRFNPRPRAGGDFSSDLTSSLNGVSIRAPARGRPQDIRVDLYPAMFQSAPPRGGDTLA